MDREQLKAKVDVDRNGKVNLDDVIAAVNGNDRKLLAIGAVVGSVVGFVVGAVLL